MYDASSYSYRSNMLQTAWTPNSMKPNYTSRLSYIIMERISGDKYINS